ncbi:unnamed protein product, partial [Allacma fusca]
APLPLLTVRSEALTPRTISLLRALYDNYIADVDSNEVVTAQEIQEEN